MVKITVLMSVYNNQNTLIKAIESILNQTYKDFEFIIINDGSTDNSDLILQEYKKKDSRIKVITNKENLGLAASLNIGLRVAEGEWVIRMDADDESLPDRIEKQINFIKMNPDIDIFGGGAIFQDIRGDIIGYYIPPITMKEIVKAFPKRNPMIHPTVCMRREAILKIGGYNENFRYGAQDYELWVRAWKRGLKILNMKDYLIKYTVNSSKETFKRLFQKFMVRNYIITKYNFPKVYYFYNIAVLGKNVLTKLKI